MEVDKQIKIIDDSISKNLLFYETQKDRGFLSQNILGDLRHFVEAICVKLSGESNYSYEIFKNTSKNFISSKSKYKFLISFHKLLQKTVSHYSQNEETSERLMLKYYDYLFEIRLVLSQFESPLLILKNLEKFPKNTDSTLQKYYEQIVNKIENSNKTKKNKIESENLNRYYIKKIKPFYINRKKYYEVTFMLAFGDENKFDKVIAFTKLEISSTYSVKLSLENVFIEIFDKNMPIQIINSWEVSIRPCELNNFGKIFINNLPKITASSKETTNLMLFLTDSKFNLVEVVNFSEEFYVKFETQVIGKNKSNPICIILDKARDIIKNKSAGHNIIRYLLYKLNNKIIKAQLNFNQPCFKLPNLNLNFGCIPFEEMPFTS
jgi:hypothetical protein